MNDITTAHLPPIVPVQPKGFLSKRPWLAVGLAVGCFVLLISAIGLGLFALFMGAMRSSDAYRVAVDAVAHDPSVLTELGAPVEPGWYMTGKIQVTGPAGHADLAIPVSGTHGAGTIQVVADKSAGKWTFSTLVVQVKGRAAPIDLLAVPTAAATAPAPAPGAVDAHSTQPPGALAE
jgi:hypothetical protein